MGAILSQTDDHNNERVISFFSKSIKAAQKNYAATDKELLAIVEAVKHYDHYLSGSEFILKTDHRPLTFMLKTRNHNARMMR